MLQINEEDVKILIKNNCGTLRKSHSSIIQLDNFLNKKNKKNTSKFVILLTYRIDKSML